MKRWQLLTALFCVSVAALGFEISLTRYFAIASWSEYGYWVISIAMVGYSASGVLLSLFKDFFQRRQQLLLACLPLALMLAAWIGFYATTLNPFNPLELQNRDLWAEQFKNIGKFYLSLFPFFFVAGLYIGLCFLSSQAVSAIYAADLAGAGVGAALALAFMACIHPFYLLTGFLPFVAVAALLCLPSGLLSKLAWTGLTLGLLVFSEWGAVHYNQAKFCEFKPITPAMNVEGARIVQQNQSARGYYLVMDDFTERLDLDLSNNYSLLRAGGPPPALGVYCDGNRMSALPKQAGQASYVKGALEAFAYYYKPSARALWIGTRGGFKLQEVGALKVAAVDALEPDPFLFKLIQTQGFDKGSEARPAHLFCLEPSSFLAERKQNYDVIDLSGEFLDQNSAYKYAFTAEAIQSYFQHLDQGGVLSMPVSIRELTVYAVKLLNTAHLALEREGVTEAASHMAIYRSAWNARLLIGREALSTEFINRLKKFCEERSFDISYYPGIRAGEQKIWNNLPPLNLDGEALTSAAEQSKDALLEECSQVLLSGFKAQGPNQRFFNLAASTFDRPFFSSVIRLSQWRAVLNNLSVFPKEEIGYLINMAVLLQALIFGFFVVVLPLLRYFREEGSAALLGKSVLYFASLGLGYLFIEILLIEKASFFLGEHSAAFAAVLCFMLIFSGLGSWLSGVYSMAPARAARWAIVGIAFWLATELWGLDRSLQAWVFLPFLLRCVLLCLWVAPVGFGLGFLFPLGLCGLGGRQGLVPWAWALNGAFSVLATPLANLITVSWGFHKLVLLCLLLYLLAFASFPKAAPRAVA